MLFLHTAFCFLAKYKQTNSRARKVAIVGENNTQPKEDSAENSRLQECAEHSYYTLNKKINKIT